MFTEALKVYTMAGGQLAPTGYLIAYWQTWSYECFSFAVRGFPTLCQSFGPAQEFLRRCAFKSVEDAVTCKKGMNGLACATLAGHGHIVQVHRCVLRCLFKNGTCVYKQGLRLVGCFVFLCGISGRVKSRCRIFQSMKLIRRSYQKKMISYIYISILITKNK